MEHIKNISRLSRKDRVGVRHSVPSFEYFIDKDKEGEVNGRHYKGVVIAKMHASPRISDWFWSVKGKYTHFDLANIIHALNPDEEQFRSSREKVIFTSIAYCFDDDVFDVEVGKKVARNKCWSKYYNKMTKFLIDILDVYNREFVSYVKDALKISTSKYRNYLEND